MSKLEKNEMDQIKDTGVTMLDVLKEEQDLEDDANAVLGGSDDKYCTYSKGYVKRQALYACTTCTPGAVTDPEKRAGVCLACSYHCHEHHELVELYTKRNFKCDCGGPKMRSNKCNLDPFKNEASEYNLYNQNFSGLYCKCNRPYPDPEDNVEDEMIQCIICEDWYHCRHLGSAIPAMHNYSEMVCSGCMNKNEFLQYYVNYAVPIVTKTSSGGKRKPEIMKIIKEKKILCEQSIRLATLKISREIAESKEISNTNTGYEISKGTDFFPGSSKAININGNNMERSAKINKDTVNMDNTIETEDVVRGTIVNKSDMSEIENEKLLEINISKVTNDLEETQDSQDAIVKETANLLEEIASMNKEFNKKNQPFTSSKEFTGDKKGNIKRLETEKYKKAVEQDIQEICENLEDAMEETKIDVTEENMYNIKESDILKKDIKSAEFKRNENEDIDMDLEQRKESDCEYNKDEKTTIEDCNKPNECLKDLGTTRPFSGTSNEKAGHSLSTDSDMEIDEDHISESPTFNSNIRINNNLKLSNILHVKKASNEEDITELIGSNRGCIVDNEMPMTSVASDLVVAESELDGKPMKKRQKLNKSVNESQKMESYDSKMKHLLKSEAESELKLSANCQGCVRPLNKTMSEGAVFWPEKWRTVLCSCKACLKVYDVLKVSFLLDMEDTVQCYEEQGRTLTTSQYEVGLKALSSLDHVKQVDAITEYNKMKDKLKKYLQTFADNQQIVTEDDIKQFFATMKDNKRTKSENPYYCR